MLTRLLLLMTLLCAIPGASCLAQPGGKRIPAGKLADADQPRVTRRWALALSQAVNVDTQIVQRFILQTTSGGRSRYQLIGSNGDGSVKVSVLVEPRGGSFYLFPDSSPEGVAVACIGCDKMVLPSWKDGWSCGKPVAGGSKCTKITASEEFR